MEKWLSKVDDSKKLILMNIPGTHDSTAYYMNRISFNWARTQNLTISDQLKIGIRRLDVRIIQANNDISLDEDIICCHGICDCYLSPNFGDRRKLTYKSILLDVKKFLEENPTEFVLFGTYLGRGNNDNPIKRAFEIFDKYIGDMSIKYKTDLTLGEVRGKVVNYTILRDEYDNKNVLKRTISQTLVSGTGISGVHAKYQNCATFKTNGNIKVKEMKEACKMACLDEFIESLPEKYNTIVGEGGVNLSGGQRQRLAIARAFVQKTEIILFDEATSALDNETQKSIQQAIRNLKKDYTILIIAHRLSTIKDCDKILYISDGKVSAEGTHDQLMKKSKEYKELYESEIEK
jgi:ABC-type phosphate transport system ATPase subunit